MQALESILSAPLLVDSVNLEALFDSFVLARPSHDPVVALVMGARYEVAFGHVSGRVECLRRLCSLLSPFVAQERSLFPPGRTGAAAEASGHGLVGGRSFVPPSYPHSSWSFLPSPHPLGSAPPHVAAAVPWQEGMPRPPTAYHPYSHPLGSALPHVAAAVPWREGIFPPPAPVGISMTQGLGGGLGGHQPLPPHSYSLPPGALATAFPGDLGFPSPGGAWAGAGSLESGSLLSRWLALCGRVQLVRLPDQTTVTDSVRLGESIAPFRAAKRGFEGSDFDFLLSAALANAPLTCFDPSLVSRWRAGVSVVRPRDPVAAQKLSLVRLPTVSAFSPASRSSSPAVSDSGELCRALQAVQKAMQHLYGIGNPTDPELARLIRLVDVDWRADNIPPNHIALIIEHGWERWRRAAHDFCMPRLDRETARVLLCPAGRLHPSFPSLFDYVCQSRFQVSAPARRGLAKVPTAGASVSDPAPSESVPVLSGASQTSKAALNKLRKAVEAAGRLKINGRPICKKFLRGECDAGTSCARSHGE